MVRILWARPRGVRDRGEIHVADVYRLTRRDGHDVGFLALRDGLPVFCRDPVRVGDGLPFLGIHRDPDHLGQIDVSPERRERDLDRVPLPGGDRAVCVRLAGIEVDLASLIIDRLTRFFIDVGRVLEPERELELGVGVGPPDRHFEGIGRAHIERGRGGVTVDVR